MCNRKQQYATTDELSKRLNVKIDHGDILQMEEDFGFDHNTSPIIKSDSPDV